MWQWIFSPTRQVAKRLREKKAIDTFCDVMRWNVLFYIGELCFASVVFVMPIAGIWKAAPLMGIILLVWRINELVAAFYTEAFARRRDPGYISADIIPGERLILVSFAYAELIICYAIIYKAIDAISSCASLTGADSWFDYFFFSGATLTTTGSGSVSPHSAASKLSAIYEAVNGIAFIAIALSTYVGDDGAGYQRTRLNTNGCFRKDAVVSMISRVRKAWE